MTDSDVEGAPVAAAKTAPVEAAVEAPISLTEFCLRHSKVEPSVELINAFFAIESHAGRTAATQHEFVARLAAFASQPAI